ncbi:MAG: nucleotidyltransferase family protein [Caldilineaceae bacterium]
MGEDAKQTVVAVVLAAGQSSRMGRPKQLEAVHGVPMVVHAATVALQSDVAHVAVVTGAYAAAVAAALKGLLTANPTRLSLLHNAEWATGQASSVRCAVERCAATANALLFLPVDQPFLPTALLQQLIAAWQQGAPLATPAIDGKIRGAPAIFDQALFPELRELTGDVGARPCCNVITISWSRNGGQPQLRDIDTPEDLLAL